MTDTINKQIERLRNIRFNLDKINNVGIQSGLYRCDPDSPEVYFLIGDHHFKSEDAEKEAEFVRFAANNWVKLLDVIEMQKNALEFYANKNFYLNGPYNYFNVVQTIDCETIENPDRTVSIAGKSAREAIADAAKILETLNG